MRNPHSLLRQHLQSRSIQRLAPLCCKARCGLTQLQQLISLHGRPQPCNYWGCRTSCRVGNSPQDWSSPNLVTETWPGPHTVQQGVFSVCPLLQSPLKTQPHILIKPSVSIFNAGCLSAAVLSFLI